MRTLRMQRCPKCNEPIPDSRNQWALWRIEEPFRCPRCATTLRMAISWKSAIAFSIMIPAIVFLEMGIYVWDGRFLFNSGWIGVVEKLALMIVIWWFAVWVFAKIPAQQLVIHSDE